MAKYRTVDEFLAVQAGAKREQIDLLRAVITSARRELTEHIKWNAPSYALDGEDRVTFNLMNKEGLVKLVLHMGATRKEDRKAPPVLADDAGLVA